MGYLLKQSQTARPLLFLLVDSTDHVTGKTGLSPTVTLSKNGAAFGAPSGAVTELSSGWYKVAGNATDTATLGPLLLHATGAAADPSDVEFEVVAFDPEDSVRLGLTALPNVAAGANGGLPTGDASGRTTVGAMAANVLTATAINADAITAAKVADGTIDAATFAAGAINAAAIATDAITAAKIAADAIGASELAADAVTEIQTAVAAGAVASVTGSVGSIAAGGITAASFAADAITAAKIAADVGTEIAAAVWDRLTSALTTVGSAGKLLVDNLNATVSSRLASASYTAPDSAATISDAVWDELISGHLGAGGTGAALNAAGSAGDPWTTPLPGAYGAGTAGKIVGDNVNATISSRASQASVDAVDDFVDTEITDIRNRLPAALVSGRMDASVGAMAANVLTAAATNADTGAEIATAVRTELATELARIDAAISSRLALAGYTAPDNATITAIASFVDTEVAAIKAKTDNLPASPAAVGSAMTLDLMQAIPDNPTDGTVGDALQAAEAQGFGKWTISGTTLTIYRHDGVTVARTFTLDSATTPTSRT